MTDTPFDAIVIGGGIAGVSVGFELSSDRSVCLVEAEELLAQHSTGRSAATVVVGIGAPQIQSLARASLASFRDPPIDVATDLLSSRPSLFFGPDDRCESFHAGMSAAVPEARLVRGRELQGLCPVLRTAATRTAVYDPTASDVDVAAFHQGYVRSLRSRGGEIRTASGVTGLTHRNSQWELQLADGSRLCSPIVVNAAGAWADEVAELAGLDRLGLVAKRRTVFISRSPNHRPEPHWPTLVALAGGFYLKPEGAAFLCSPVDATPEPPGDARPDEEQIARAIEAINDSTTLGVRSVSFSWAGQRSFFVDELPAVGFSHAHCGFFWLAGQGGYGIQTAPALSRVAASLIRGTVIAPDLLSHGVDVAELDPSRMSAPSSARDATGVRATEASRSAGATEPVL